VDKTRVLFLCLGNICRSPLAEGLFAKLAVESGVAQHFEVDSAGTGASYHLGEPADARSQRVAQQHGFTLQHRARQLVVADFEQFDYILCMDRKNFHHAQRLSEQVRNARAQCMLMRTYDPKGPGDVPDPFHGEQRDFEQVYEMLARSCQGLLTELMAGAKTKATGN